MIMNTTELIERLRAADAIEVENVDAIVAEALRQGQRRRVRQRALPVLAGVIALVTAVGLAGVLAIRDGRSSTPVATTTPSTPSSPSAVRPSPIGAPLTSADVLGVVEAYLPEGMSATEIGLWNNAEASEATKRNHALVVMHLKDKDGPARADAALSQGGNSGSGCTREGHCRRIRVGGKTFYEYTDWKMHRGIRLIDVGTYYERPDGLVTSIMQHNFVDDDGPVTRPTARGKSWPVTGPALPLTQAEVQALLTAPEWDALAPRCRYDRIWGYC
jgi:hypothetical protein